MVRSLKIGHPPFSDMPIMWIVINLLGIDGNNLL